MNIAHAAQLVGAKRVVTASALVAVATPLAAAKTILSVREIMTNTRAIHERQLLDQVSNKIVRAARGFVAGDRSAVPAFGDDEKSLIQRLGEGFAHGAAWVARAAFKGALTAMRMVVRYLAVPVFRLVGQVMLRALPLIFSPAGLAILGGGLLAVGAYKLYKRLSGPDLPLSGREEMAVPAATPVGGVESAEPTTAPLPVLRAPEVPLPRTEGVERPSTMTGVPVSKVPQTTITPKEGKALPKGIRNNNPGNLRYAGQPGADPKSRDFAVFSSQNAGLFNLGRQVGLHYYKRGLNTVDKLIRTWAPPNENDTQAYIKSVSKQIGVPEGRPFDFQDYRVLKALMKAIVVHENGMNPYSEQQFDEAAKAAITLFADYGMVFPTTGIVSSLFGRRVAPTKGASTHHGGIDIAAPTGTPVVAATSGTIARTGTAGGYGNLIDVRGSMFYTRYGHLSKISVIDGQPVQKGQIIGEVGNTGISSGPHLHFEVRTITASGVGSVLDPMQFFGAAKGQQVVAAARPIVLPLSRDTTLIRTHNDHVVRVQT